MSELLEKNKFSRRQILKTIAAGSILGVTGGFLTACSNAGPTYYTLSVSPGTIYRVNPCIIEVRTPSLAGYLDKDRIVSEISHNELNLSTSAAWGDNISNMIGRIVMLDLSQRLTNASVFLQNQATQTKPQAYVELDISRFNQDATGKAVLTADLVVRQDGEKGKRFNRLLTLEKMPENSSIKALVVTLSQLLGEVSDIAASNLIDLPNYHYADDGK